MKRKKYLLIFLLFLFCFTITFGKGYTYKYNIVYEENGITHHFSVLNNTSVFIPSNELEYFWYGNGSFKSNRGGFYGNLLHGDYKAFDLNNNLIKMGSFKHGAKDGEWKFWDSGGKLTCDEIWRKGYLSKKWFQEGNKEYVEKYKKNKLTGKRMVFENEELVKIQHYKNGKMINEKLAIPLRNIKDFFRKKK